MGHRVADDAHTQLCGNLLHDGCFADARRPHEKNGALTHNGYLILAEFIFGKIRRHGVFYFFFCFLNVHVLSPYSVAKGMLFLFAYFSA